MNVATKGRVGGRVGGAYLERGLQRHAHHLLIPPTTELRPNTALHKLLHDGGVLDVYGDGALLGVLECKLEGAVVAANDDRGVDVAAEERLGHGEHLAGKNDDGSGAVADLLVLRASELDHGLGGGVRHVNLAEDAIAVVRHNDPAHGIEEHLEHGAGAEGGADYVRDGHGGGDVAELRFTTSCSLGVLV